MDIQRKHGYHYCAKEHPWHGQCTTRGAWGGKWTAILSFLRQTCCGLHNGNVTKQICKGLNRRRKLPTIKGGTMQSN